MMKNLIVIVILVLCLSVAKGNKQPVFIECDPAKASAEKSNSECPPNAQCVELGNRNDTSSNTSGLCACKTNYTVNRNYSSADNNSLYCIQSNKTQASSTAAPPPAETQPPASKVILTTTLKPKILKTTIAPTPHTEAQPTKKSEPDESSAKQTDKPPLQEKINVSSQTHHIFGGIVLPVLVVLAFLGIVYGIRKHDVLERAQNYIRNRRNGQTHQTRYDGLENDFDDDPLLI